MPVQPSSFADRLTALREAAGLSQYALAKKAGLSKQALSNLELGNREPNWETVQRLAKALGASCEAFTDPDLQMPTEAEAALGRPGRPPKALPAMPPASDLETEASKRHRQKQLPEGQASKRPRGRKGK